MNFWTGDLYIHYTWIGKALCNERDTTGPRRMGKALSDDHWTTHHVYFWCLDKHVKTYTTHFKDVPKITVRGIESSLKSFTTTASRWYNWYGNKEDAIVKIVTQVIDEARKDEATGREIVNGKNAWSLFTLYMWGGYAFDAGIWPTSGSVSLPWEKSFKAPAALDGPLTNEYDHYTLSTGGLDGVCTALLGTATILSVIENTTKKELRHYKSSQKVWHLDVWALCSPQYDYMALRAIETYCRFWTLLEAWRKQKPIAWFDEEAYRACSREAIVSSVFAGLSHTKLGACVQPTRAAFWNAGKSISVDGVRVPALSIEKHYYGSHRLENEGKKKEGKGDKGDQKGAL